MNTTPSLWTRLKAKLAGLAKRPPITTTKPDHLPPKLQVLRGQTDGLHPIHRDYENRWESYTGTLHSDDKIQELNQTFDIEQDDSTRTQVDVTFALPPRQMGKTNMTHTRARAHGVPMAPIFDERFMVDSEAPLDMEELLNKYPFLYSAGEQERNEKFIQSFKDHFKDHPEAYANADSLEAVGAMIEAKINEPHDLIHIDSLGHLADSGPVGIVVMGDRHPSMSRHLTSLSLAALSNAMSQRVVLSLDALSPSTDKMVEILNNMEMCVEPAVVRDKPWIEMNQPYQRRKKRSRPGRKHKYEK